MDIRTLTFATMPAHSLIGMATGKIAKMDQEDSELSIKDVDGAGGQGRDAQRAFYEEVVSKGGIPDTQIQSSVANFRVALKDFDAAYAANAFLAGTSLSLADVAIWVDVERLLKVAPGGFSIAVEFPNLFAAHQRLAAQVGTDMVAENGKRTGVGGIGDA
jgi:glutathione S-transferase